MKRLPHLTHCPTVKCSWPGHPTRGVFIFADAVCSEKNVIALPGERLSLVIAYIKPAGSESRW